MKNDKFKQTLFLSEMHKEKDPLELINKIQTASNLGILEQLTARIHEIEDNEKMSYVKLLLASELLQLNNYR